MRKRTVCATALLQKRNACITNCSFGGFCVDAGLLPVHPKAGRDRALSLQRSPPNFAWNNRRTNGIALMLSTRCELGKLYQISVQKSKPFLTYSGSEIGAPIWEERYVASANSIPSLPIRPWVVGCASPAMHWSQCSILAPFAAMPQYRR